MRTLLAHVRKELRDQRAVMLGVLGALPPLTLLAFWGFGSVLSDAPLDDALNLIVPIALVLFLLAIAGDAFAGEIRRGTHGFLQRTPGALPWSFAGKVVTVALGMGAVLLWQSLWLWIAWALWGRYDLPSVLAVAHEAFLMPLTHATFIVAAWMLLASTWLRHGGLALLLAPLVLGALLVPALLWAKSNGDLADWFLESRKDGWLLLVLAFVAVPLLAALYGHLRGRRFVRSAWSVVWRSSAVLLVLFAAGYAWAGLEIRGALTLEPGDAEVFAWHGRVGRGSKLCFLQVQRIGGGKPLTPSRTWVVDLEDGTWRALGPWGTRLDAPAGLGVRSYGRADNYTLEPTSWIVQRRPWTDVWIDGRTGEVRKQLAPGTWTPDVLAMEEEVALEATWLRDPDGRRAWRRRSDGALRFEGDGEGPRVGKRIDAPPFHTATSWGWIHREGVKNRGWKTSLFDLHTRETRVDGPSSAHRQYPTSRVALTRTASRTPAFTLRDLDTGEIRELGTTPDGVTQLAYGAQGSPLVAIAQSEAGPQAVLWDPVEGTKTPLRWVLAAQDDVAPRVGWVWVEGRAGDGRLVLRMGRQGDTACLVVVDPRAATARLVGGGATTNTMLSLQVIAIEASGSLLAIEYPHTIVRLGPLVGQREVLFPR